MSLPEAGGQMQGIPYQITPSPGPSFTPSTLSPGTSRAASNGKRSYLRMRTSRKGCTILVDGNGASWGKFSFSPSPGSLQEQVESSSTLHETQRSRWFGQGGERPERNGGGLASGAGTLTTRPLGSSPSRDRIPICPKCAVKPGEAQRKVGQASSG